MQYIRLSYVATPETWPGDGPSLSAASANHFIYRDVSMENTPLRYSLRQLRYFVVTAEALSFTAASKILRISQPSISTAVAELEESFGVQLFIRHHASGLSMTQAGHEMLGKTRDLLKNAEELQVTARGMDT